MVLHLGWRKIWVRLPGRRHGECRLTLGHRTAGPEMEGILPFTPIMGL